MEILKKFQDENQSLIKKIYGDVDEDEVDFESDIVDEDPIEVVHIPQTPKGLTTLPEDKYLCRGNSRRKKPCLYQDKELELSTNIGEEEM